MMLLRNKEQSKLTREDKALQLFRAGAFSKVSDDLYHMRSQKYSNVGYEVIPSMGVCICADFDHGLICYR